MVLDCKSLKKEGNRGKQKRNRKETKRNKKEKKGENEEIGGGGKGESVKGKREKVIMCLFTVERSYIQEIVLVRFVGL